MSTPPRHLPRKRTAPYAPQLAFWGAPLRQLRPPSGEPQWITAPDGLQLFAQATGNPDGPEILFIHGFSQCHLSWRRQMGDPELASEFRLAAYDLRGHGLSEKPFDVARYSEDRIWADDLAAVIDALGMKRPLLVAWSYAGRVVSDYVRLYGQERIAGINYVAAVTHTDRAYWGPELRHTLAMANDDLTTNIRASRKFVQACFGGRPVGEELDMTLAYTMLVPSRVRAAVMKRSRNSGEVLPELRVPVLVTHGALDRIILPGIADYTAAAVPGGKLSVYEGVGHSPFFEDAPRFNRELAAFARATQQPAST